MTEDLLLNSVLLFYNYLVLKAIMEIIMKINNKKNYYNLW